MNQRHWTERAKERMRVLNMKRPALANAIGVTPGAIGHYLTGRRKASDNVLDKIARALKVESSWLVHGANPPAIPETVGERVIYARRRQDLSQAQLAQKLGWPVQQLVSVEANQVPPPYPDALAAQLYVSQSWLLKGTPMAEDAYQSNLSPGPGSTKMIPVLGWTSAGSWREAIQQVPEDCEMIPVPGSFSGNCFGLRIEGDSMVNPNLTAPSFPPGMLIVVDPDRQPEIGQYVVVIDRVHNDAIFKQYVRDSGKIFLKPLNPQYPMVEMQPTHEVCGVIVSSVQRYV